MSHEHPDTPAAPPSAWPVALAALAVAALAAAAGLLRPGPSVPTATEPPPSRTEPPATRPAPEAEVAAVVTMNISRFFPEKVTVRVGQTVEWQNTDVTMWHSVTTVPERAADKRNVALPPGATPFHHEIWPGEACRHTFTVPGDYRYFCQPHEAQGMVGEVRVLPR